MDSGNARQLSKSQIPQVLHLKKGAPVVLLANLTDKLVNGVQGVVDSMFANSVIVHLASLQTSTTLVPHRFTVYDPKLSREVACRKQIPLKLAFAFTVHRAQRLTIPRHEVDCRKMGFPGQLGVALSRAQTLAIVKSWMLQVGHEQTNGAEPING